MQYPDLNLDTFNQINKKIKSSFSELVHNLLNPIKSRIFCPNLQNYSHTKPLNQSKKFQPTSYVVNVATNKHKNMFVMHNKLEG